MEESTDKSESQQWFDLRSGENKNCEVHGIPLEEGKAEIAYGLIGMDDRYWQDKRYLFPNSNAWVLGGCIAQDIEFAEVDFCQECRQAEKVWHQIKKMLSVP